MIQTLFGSTEEKPSFLERMKEAVTRTRESLSERIEDIASFGKEIDSNTLDELESTLISADLGMATTSSVLDALRAKVDRKQIGDITELKRVLKEELLKILNVAEARPVRKVDGEPEVILGGRREWHRENHLYRQTRLCPAFPGKDGLAGGGRYIPRGSHRATGDLGRPHRSRSD